MRNTFAKLAKKNKNEDPCQVIVECPNYTEIRSQKINFVLNCTKAEFYYLMDQLSLKRIKNITQFMSIVEEGRIQRR